MMITDEFPIAPDVVGEEDIAAATAFYCDILNGTQARTAPANELWFVVGGVLIETGPGAHTEWGRVAIEVENPEDVAAKCWDGGFTVRTEGGAPCSPRLTLVDPFGLEIALVKAVVG